MLRKLWRKMRTKQAHYEDFEAKVFSYLKFESESWIVDLCKKMNFDEPAQDLLIKLQGIAKKHNEKKFLEELESLGSEDKQNLPFEINRGDLVESAQKVAYEQLCDLVRGKDVVLIGPSAYTTGSKRADWIESFDLVARINFQWPVVEDRRADLGSRMDLLFHCCNGDYPVDSLFCGDFKKIKFVCLEQNIASLQVRKYCDAHNVPNLYFNPTLKNLSLALRGLPSTGLTALVSLLRLPLKELHVYGMTFWADAYYSGYQGDGALQGHWQGKDKPEKIWQHEPAIERRHLQLLIKQNPHLKVDEAALRIMKLH